ncbi:DUF1566 domain-containing protein [Pseudomonas sp. ERGC3:05]|nr:DUF1566 domain-containing protein [Pseudomonas sp. ERGC3:01]QZC95121.1 DUF1566 domain-containing protein [Pseudomonas sp. ERGC3:05]
MKSPLINIRNLNISVSTFLPEQLAASASYLEPVTVATAAPAGDALTPPAIGEIWPGQGGIYAGIRQYSEGLCHVIFAADDLGPYPWSNTSFDLITSRVDGRENTEALNACEHSNPAAEHACNYGADGHQDFYLPSIGELSHAWLYTPESFAKEAYWSSSQRSAYGAYTVDFEDGWLGNNAKHNERLARPVRRILQ